MKILKTKLIKTRYCLNVSKHTLSIIIMHRSRLSKLSIKLYNIGRSNIKLYFSSLGYILNKYQIL